MNRTEKFRRIHELNDIRSNQYLSIDEYEELCDHLQDVINMYHTCIDINDISDEDLEGQDGYQ